METEQKPGILESAKKFGKWAVRRNYLQVGKGSVADNEIVLGHSIIRLVGLGNLGFLDIAMKVVLNRHGLEWYDGIVATAIALGGTDTALTWIRTVKNDQSRPEEYDHYLDGVSKITQEDIEKHIKGSKIKKFFKKFRRE